MIVVVLLLVAITEYLKLGVKEWTLILAYDS